MEQLAVQSRTARTVTGVRPGPASLFISSTIMHVVAARLLGAPDHVATVEQCATQPRPGLPSPWDGRGSGLHGVARSDPIRFDQYHH